MDLVLDLDGTLIAQFPKNHEERESILPRPHVKEFLSFCFANFRVSVWTAASERWGRKVTRKLGMHRKLHRLHCGARILRTRSTQYVVKELRTRFGLRHTVIVDDNADTYALNQDSAVPISTFEGMDGDTELLEVRTKLERLVQTYHATPPAERDVRSIIKGGLAGGLAAPTGDP